jgi:hypothetical protein
VIAAQLADPPFWAICGCPCAHQPRRADLEVLRTDRSEGESLNQAIVSGASNGFAGLCLPMPDGSVGQDVALGARPLDLAAFELLLVQRRIHAAVAQQGGVVSDSTTRPASVTLMTPALTMVDGR